LRVAAGATLTHMPTLRTEVMGTAGAGDAFASTLAAQLADGAGDVTALRAASVNAAAAVSAADTQSGLLDAGGLQSAASAAAETLTPQVWRWAADR